MKMIDGFRQFAQNGTDLTVISVEFCNNYRLYEKKLDIDLKLKYNVIEQTDHTYPEKNAVFQDKLNCQRGKGVDVI